MSDRLVDRVIAITGGSSGIGLATAKRCAAEGAQVVLLARGQEQLQVAAATIGAAALPITCDVVDPQSVRDAFAQIADRSPQLDALLNIAGGARIRTIEEASDAEGLALAAAA